MKEQWPLGPYLVFNPLDFKRHPAGSLFEAKQIADRLEEEHHAKMGVYRYVADDDAYMPVEE